MIQYLLKLINASKKRITKLIVIFLYIHFILLIAKSKFKFPKYNRLIK